MGDVRIDCGVGVAGGAGQGIGGGVARRGAITCPKCRQNAMVRMAIAPSGEPATNGAAVRGRVYRCTTPECGTQVKTVETSEGETVKGYL